MLSEQKLGVGDQVGRIREDQIAQSLEVRDCQLWKTLRLGHAWFSVPLICSKATTAGSGLTFAFTRGRSRWPVRPSGATLR
jgi:hypothetical protein